MNLALIVFAWLLLPGIILAAATMFYVPWFLDRYRAIASPAADELATKRALRSGSVESEVA
jgi:hypothetical protein